MQKNDNSVIQSHRHDVSAQDDETDIEFIDEDHLFKTKQTKPSFSSFKADELIYSSSSTSSKSSDSSSPPLSYSSRHYGSSINSELSAKSTDKKINEKAQSNSLLELNSKPIRKNNKGEALKKRNASVENSIYSVLESARSNEAKSPKTIWKNDPQNLIKGSFNFVVNVSLANSLGRKLF
jgi:hypothetical protein